MQGQVLDFSIQSNTGIITADDGTRYEFSGEDWKDGSQPLRGMAVDFSPEGSRAVGVYKSIAQSASGKKDKTAAGLLAIFLGGLGVHKFYLGFTGPGLVYLLTNTIGFFVTWIFLFIPNLILGIMAFIEGIIYLTKTDEDFEREYVTGKKMWF